MAMQEEIVELLSRLPEPYKSRALSRRVKHSEDVLAPLSITTIISALDWGFNWREAPEGSPFWKNVGMRVALNMPLPPPVSFPSSWPEKKTS